MGAEVRQLSNWINGEWVESAGTERIDVDNPATGEVIASVPLSTETEIDAAVRTAKAAFPAWRDTPAVDRGRLLFRLHGLMRERFEELSQTVTIENGKTLEEARGEVLRAVENVELGGGHSHLAARLILQRHFGGHRRALDPRAAGRVWADWAFQLPGDGALLVRSAGGRVRQHLRHQAVAKDASEPDAADGADGSSGLPARRDELGARRRRAGAGAERPSGRGRGVVRGLDAGGAGRI